MAITASKSFKRSTYSILSAKAGSILINSLITVLISLSSDEESLISAIFPVAKTLKTSCKPTRGILPARISPTFLGNVLNFTDSNQSAKSASFSMAAKDKTDFFIFS
ncbi:hypothetical protein D3C73_1119830 [compost metagenome]